MDKMIVRISENKREIGIPSTFRQSLEAQLTSKSEDVEYSQDTGDVGQSCISLNSKCFNRHRNLNKKRNLRSIEPHGLPNSNNKKEMKASKASGTLQKSLKEGLKNLTHHIGSLSMKILRKEVSDSTPINNTNKNVNTITKDRTDLQNRTTTGKGFFKYDLIKTGLKKSERDINNNTSDDESRRKHPNRRLQVERIECDLPAKKACYPAGENIENTKTCRLRSVTVPVLNREDCAGSQEKRPRPVKLKIDLREKKPSKDGIIPQEVKLIKVNDKSQSEKSKHGGLGLWKNVLQSQNPEVETVYSFGETQDTNDTDLSDNKNENDYQRLLRSFVLQTMKENSRGNGKTVYEKRVEEMMEDPNWKGPLRELYVPPALVEVFHYKTPQNETAQEGLKRICELKNWPEPAYTCRSSEKEGFLYRCTVKSTRFHSSKPASNEDLAKELVASQCLEWLGLYPRPPQEDSPLHGQKDKIPLFETSVE